MQQTLTSSNKASGRCSVNLRRRGRRWRRPSASTRAAAKDAEDAKNARQAVTAKTQQLTKQRDDVMAVRRCYYNLVSCVPEGILTKCSMEEPDSGPVASTRGQTVISALLKKGRIRAAVISSPGTQSAEPHPRSTG